MGEKLPKCDAGGTLRQMELQLALIQNEDLALEKKKREIEAWSQIEHDELMEVKRFSAAYTPAQLGTALLNSMKFAMRDELFTRYSTFPTSTLSYLQSLIGIRSRTKSPFSVSILSCLEWCLFPEEAIRF